MATVSRFVELSKRGVRQTAFLRLPPAAPLVIAKNIGIHKFASVQFNLPADVASRVLELGRTIDATDLAGAGIEKQPHLTVKYGLLDSSLAAVQELLQDVATFRCAFDRTIAFPPSEHSDWAAPLVIEVHSLALKELHRRLLEVEGAQPDNFDYHPHTTLAYVTPASVDKYTGLEDLMGLQFEVDRVWFATTTGDQIELPLRAVEKRRASTSRLPGRRVTFSHAKVVRDNPDVARAVRRLEDKLRVHLRKAGRTAALAISRHAETVFGKYSEDQPRDEQGRWTETGGVDPAKVQVARDRLTSAISWDRPNDKGRVIVARGGKVNYKSGPNFFTSDPDFAIGYSDYGKRELATWSIKKDTLMTTASFEFEHKFGDKFDDMGPDLFTSTPKEVLDYVHERGKSGLASDDGQYIRVEDWKKAGLRLHLYHGHVMKFGKYSEDEPRDEQGRWTSAGVETYHGTAATNAERIKKEGLKLFPGKHWQVWATARKEEALGYTGSRTREWWSDTHNGSNRVPADTPCAIVVLKKTTPFDPKFRGPAVDPHFTTSQNISAKYISRVEIYKYSDIRKVELTGSTEKIKPIKVLKSDDDEDGYIIPLDPEMLHEKFAKQDDRGGWIGVDLDGTLAQYDGYKGPGVIGEPVPKMLARVQQWLEEGKDVRILTARAAGPEAEQEKAAIEAWLIQHLGCTLPIVSGKDHKLVELWDDRAVQVVPNTGERADGLDKYSEDETRDERGRWTTSAGGSWADPKPVSQARQDAYYDLAEHHDSIKYHRMREGAEDYQRLATWQQSQVESLLTNAKSKITGTNPTLKGAEGALRSSRENMQRQEFYDAVRDQDRALYLIHTFIMNMGGHTRKFDKYSEDEARDDHGRWAKGSGLQLDESPPLDVQNFQQTLTNEGNLDGAEAKNEVLYFRNLTATQKYVNRADVKEIRREAGRATPLDPIDVVRYKGKDYIADGHHRSAVAIGRGDKRINAVVWTLNPSIISRMRRENREKFFKYSEDEPRDEQGKWTASEHFHGARSVDDVDSILQHGLRPGQDRYANAIADREEALAFGIGKLGAGALTFQEHGRWTLNPEAEDREIPLVVVDPIKANLQRGYWRKTPEGKRVWVPHYSTRNTIPPSAINRIEIYRAGDLVNADKMFDKESLRRAKPVRVLYPKSEKFAKADISDEELDRLVALAYDSEDWQDLVPDVEEILREIAQQGGLTALGEMKIDDESLLSESNDAAADYASERAAEMVGMKRTATGKLVPNPDAQWAISDTTRDDLRDIIEKAFEEETPIDELVTSIEDAGTFSESRAKMIAKTEAAKALVGGNIAVWRMLDVPQVQVVLSEDHDRDDECDEAVANGPYDLDNAPDVPIHPNCECALETYVEGA